MMQVQQRSISLYWNEEKLYNDLSGIEYHLQTLEYQQRRITTAFNEWYDHRKVTIETIDSLRKKIDSVCMGCNVARGVGAATGIFGLFAGIVGTILEVKGHESAKNFMQASKYCTGAGVVAAGSSILLELGLSQSAINEIRRVLQRDEELTKPLRDWMQISRKVDILANKLFQCSIASATLCNFMEVIGQGIKLLDAGQSEVEHFIRDLDSCKREDIGDLTSVIALRIKEHPRLLQPLREISRIFQKTPYTFEFAKLGTVIYSNLYGVMNSGHLSFLLSAAGLSCPDVVSRFLSGTLGFISLAAHVVTIILAAKNIKEGVSKHSKELKTVKYALQSELDELLIVQSNYHFTLQKVG